jgi:hypothetical protein
MSVYGLLLVLQASREEIIHKLREADVLLGQGKAVSDDSEC